MVSSQQRQQESKLEVMAASFFVKQTLKGISWSSPNQSINVHYEKNMGVRDNTGDHFCWQVGFCLTDLLERLSGCVPLARICPLSMLTKWRAPGSCDWRIALGFKKAAGEKKHNKTNPPWVPKMEVLTYISCM